MCKFYTYHFCCLRESLAKAFKIEWDLGSYAISLNPECLLERNSNIVLEILDIIMLCKHNVPEAYFILGRENHTRCCA